MATTHDTTALLAGSAELTATAHVTRDLVMTPDAAGLIADLSRRTGRDEGDVLSLALAMLKVAVDAKERGQHVGIAGSAEALEIELVGF